jgi:uncharacterized protein (TIGR02646 family)
MRPVIRGDNAKVFKIYQDARGDLIEQLGQYCSYCEMPLPSSLDVEHILQKKEQFPDEETNWKNFCLACKNCNSTKNGAMDRRWKDSWQYLHLISAKIAARSEFYWIDQDNTFQCVEYSKGGLVKVNLSLAPEEQKVAQATIEMVGLDRIPNPDPKVKDRRWNNRREAWEKAERSLIKLNKCDNDDFLEMMRDTIVDLAVAQGFWSVWMTVFKDYPDMLQRFISAFPGTCGDCFDMQGKAIHRPNGRI